MGNMGFMFAQIAKPVEILGVASALRSRGSLGLIWIDAHRDAHTPQTATVLRTRPWNG